MCAANVLRSLADGRRVCACATQEWLLFEAVLTVCYAAWGMQKERPQFIKVRPRTVIERKLHLTDCAPCYLGWSLLI